jgi:hypothetical protein
LLALCGRHVQYSKQPSDLRRVPNLPSRHLRLSRRFP